MAQMSAIHISYFPRIKAKLMHLATHSLREIEQGLKTCEGKLAHLGIETVARSSLAYANAHRPWELYQKLFFALFARCRSAAPPRRKFRFKNRLVSLDSERALPPRAHPRLPARRTPGPRAGAGLHGARTAALPRTQSQSDQRRLDRAGAGLPRSPAGELRHSVSEVCDSVGRDAGG
jgi:hypothetical protein